MDLKEVVGVVLSPKFDEDSIQYLQTKIQFLTAPQASCGALS